MVKSIRLRKKEVLLILLLFISLLSFQLFLPYIVADVPDDGLLHIDAPQSSFYVNMGNSVTITWTFSVPSHDYAVYWEIKGYGIDINGWGLNANCTTPVISTYDIYWNYRCDGWYSKYSVWTIVNVIGPEEPPPEEPPPEEPTNGENGYIPGFAPYFFIFIFSICMIGVIFLLHSKVKLSKFEK